MKHMILKTYLILLIANFLFSQKIDLNKKFAFDSHHATFEIISDSLYYIVSNMADKNHLKKRGIIAILNKNGELNNLIELGQNNNYILSSTRLQSNDFLFIGYNKENNDEWNKIYVVKTDKNLNTLWEKSYGPLNNNSKGYSIVESNENEYWILGHTKASKNGALVLKIDNEGNEMWFSYLPGLDCNFANNMIITSDKQLIISGQKSNQLFISKINQKGEVLWQYNYFNDNKYHRIYDIKITQDEGIIAVGNTTQSENHSFDILIIKLTKNGQKEWIKKIGNKTNEVAYEIEQNKSLEYVIVGYALVDKKTKKYNSFLIKTDSLGNKLSRLDFNSNYIKEKETSKQLYDIVIKEKNNAKIESYLGVGNIFNNEGNSEIWFLKIDAINSN